MVRGLSREQGRQADARLRADGGEPVRHCQAATANVVPLPRCVRAATVVCELRFHLAPPGGLVIAFHHLLAEWLKQRRVSCVLPPRLVDDPAQDTLLCQGVNKLGQFPWARWKSSTDEETGVSPPLLGTRWPWKKMYSGAWGTWGLSLWLYMSTSLGDSLAGATLGASSRQPTTMPMISGGRTRRRARTG